MAITMAALTSGATATDSASLTTASITPTTNRLVVAAVQNDFGTDPPTIPTATGCSLTWKQLATVTFFSSSGGRVTVFVAMGTATTGTVVFDCAGTTQTGWNHSICEFAGTEGSGSLQAIAQFITSTTGTITGGSPTTITLASPRYNGASATYAAIAHNTNEAGTVQSSPAFTQVHVVNHGTPARGLVTEWDATVQQSASATWASNGVGFGVVMEIRPALDNTFAGVPI